MVPDARDPIRDVLSTVFEGPAKALVDIVSPKELGRPKLTGKLLLLPLRSDLGDVSRAIGCVQFEGNIGRTPRRFDMAGVKFQRLGPFKTEDLIERAQIKSDDLTGFEEPAAEFKSPKRAKGDGSHLRLVKTDSNSD